MTPHDTTWHRLTRRDTRPGLQQDLFAFNFDYPNQKSTRHRFHKLVGYSKEVKILGHRRQVGQQLFVVVKTTTNRFDVVRSFCFLFIFILITLCFCPVNICGMSDVLTNKRIVYLYNFVWKPETNWFLPAGTQNIHSQNTTATFAYITG